MKYYLKNIISLMVVLNVLNYAQDKPAASDGSLTFYLDYACFAGSDEKTHTEFYLMFFGDQVFEQEKDISRLEITMKIIDQDGKETITTDWVTEITNEDSAAAQKVIYDSWSKELEPGNYNALLTASLPGSDISGKTTLPLSIPLLSDSVFSSSTIQFLSTASGESEKLRINPNPSRRYGLMNPQLLFKYEVYGTDKEQLTADYSIINKDGAVQKKLENLTIKKVKDPFTVIHGIDVSDLQSGIYKLDIVINDQLTNKWFNTSRVFEVMQTDFFESKPSVTEEEADIFQTILEYIGKSDQLNMYESLDLNGKSQFMIKFWKSKDPNPATEENEYLQEIQRRFNHAKNKFGWGKTPGYKSDRGRIAIKYGIPHQVKQYNNEASTDPYEIWTYNENRTYQFIFGDVYSNGQYILLHSNREGEIYNSRWKEQIEKM